MEQVVAPMGRKGPPTRLTFNPSDDYSTRFGHRTEASIVFASSRDGSLSDFYQKPAGEQGRGSACSTSSIDVAPYQLVFRWTVSVVYRGVSSKGRTEVWVLPLSGDRKPSSIPPSRKS